MRPYTEEHPKPWKDRFQEIARKRGRVYTPPPISHPAKKPNKGAESK